MTFYSSVVGVLNIHAPMVTKRILKRSIPWISSDLRRRIKERDKLFTRAKRTSNPMLLEQYKNLRRDIKQDIKSAKNRYLGDLVLQQSSPNKMWSCLRRCGLVGGVSLSALHHFAPSTLNRHYVSISSSHPLCDHITFSSILSRPIPNGLQSFTFSPISHLEVLSSLNSILKKFRGLSPDQLPLAHLKQLFSVIVPYLVTLFNQSLSLGVFPSAWKSSFIIPLKKNPSPSNPSDTRTIANPPHLSKVIDSLVTHQIVAFHEANKLLHPKQCGFRRYHSTQTALLYLLDDIRMGVDRGYVTILVLFDFSKAFDSLSHSVILTCLRDIGFEDLALWMRSFLSGRSQSIIGLDGQPCQPEFTTSGVPQGTSLGPILFIIVINTLFSKLQYCRDTTIIFTDDTQLYLSTPISRINDTVQLINSDTAELLKWTHDYGLTLNARKTKAIILGSTQNLASFNGLLLPPIIVGTEVIPYSDHVMNLGVIISSDLSWN
ncbi:PREDICTED: RNA-directed DNA polymerase from mobile element jockey-like [Cyphomyrmex costatus]|uniref:RNA-directed DNA polymerase from mobile element jockey-like n=1 Tax=Cyphomyrmex costatus TaxID=456900 RepID=UPI00085227EF|nr:PREDICTED: RNA-directed DNA polymerase from mobile element jockey-like [Cyphomyrmex costatus]